MQTNFQYFLSDPMIAVKAIDKLANLTIDELNGMVISGRNNYWNFITEMICENEGFNPKTIGSMTYKELVAIICNIGGNSKYYKSYDEQLFDYFLIYTMLCSSDSTVVKKFFSIPRVLFWQVKNALALQIPASEIEYHAIEYTSEETIKECLNGYNNIINKRYSPLTDEKEFVKANKEAHRDIGKILVNAIASMYGGECNYWTVVDKYHEEEDLSFEESEELEYEDIADLFV